MICNCQGQATPARTSLPFQLCPFLTLFPDALQIEYDSAARYDMSYHATPDKQQDKVPAPPALLFFYNVTHYHLNLFFVSHEPMLLL